MCICMYRHTGGNDSVTNKNIKIKFPCQEVNVFIVRDDTL